MTDDYYFNQITGKNIDWANLPEPSTATTYTCKECGKEFPIIRHDPDTILGNFLNSVRRQLCGECAQRLYQERFGKGILDVISSDTQEE